MKPSPLKTLNRRRILTSTSFLSGLLRGCGIISRRILTEQPRLFFWLSGPSLRPPCCQSVLTAFFSTLKSLPSSFVLIVLSGACILTTSRNSVFLVIWIWLPLWVLYICLFTFLNSFTTLFLSLFFSSSRVCSNLIIAGRSYILKLHEFGVK